MKGEGVSMHGRAGGMAGLNSGGESAIYKRACHEMQEIQGFPRIFSGRRLQSCRANWLESAG
jgi:hypothetical protein